MQRESNWRYYFILIVTLLCIYFILPTARYGLFVFRREAPVRGPEQTEEAYKAAVDEYDAEKGDLQREAINLGLDLVGGVDVLLKIDEDKMRVQLLAQQREAVFNRLRDKMIAAEIPEPKAADTALVVKVTELDNVRQVSNVLDDYVDTIFDPYDQAAFERTGTVQLVLRDQLLRREIRDSIESAENTIRGRVDEFGVTQPSVSLQNNSSIRVQVPGEKDPEYVITQVIKPAQLEFYVLHEESEELAPKLYELVEEENHRRQMEEVFRLRENAEFPVGYMGMEGQERDDSVKTDQPVYRSKMYIVKKQPEMTGEHLRDAWVRTDMTNIANPIAISLVFGGEGRREFRAVTKETLGKRLAVALDGRIHTAPTIQSVIQNGQAEITGSFKALEARDLALVLKAGALPADLAPDELRIIGPTLGADSIRLSVRALGIGAACITVFMVLYYGTAGVISIVALLLNMFLILACLDMFNATLTLSGIGGMILTLGMAVDANVLIYERIREELAMGRDPRSAIRSGFNRAFSVIFDSNLTTMLAAFVLLQFGEGSVQGFALTMTFGLLANLFTGLTVTYALCRLWFNFRGNLSLGVLHMFRNTHIDFIAMRFGSIVISAVLVVGALTVLVVRGGPQYAVDFKGGVMSEVRMTQIDTDTDLTERIKNALTATGLPGEQAKVQRVKATAHSEYLVRLALQTDPTDAENEVTFTEAQIRGALEAEFTPAGFEMLGTQGVSQEVGSSFQKIAFFVVIAASLCILAYLWFRFEFAFGLAAVIALIHDLTITLGAITLLDIQISLDIVSGLLILLGFSVNDTIVIFDRVRENSHTMFGKPFKEICNHAMNRSLSRTIITSVTTIGVMAIMYQFGGTSLAPFAMTLIIGGAIGTYSSSFVATPFVYWWNQRQEGRLSDALGRSKAGQPKEEEPSTLGGAQAPAKGTNGPSAPRRRGRR